MGVLNEKRCKICVALNEKRCKKFINKLKKLNKNI